MVYGIYTWETAADVVLVVAWQAAIRQDPLYDLGWQAVVGQDSSSAGSKIGVKMPSCSINSACHGICACINLYQPFDTV